MFDINEFWKNQKDTPKEKAKLWQLPIVLILLALIQALFLAPFVIAALLFGKQWALLGWIGVGILFLVGYFLRRFFRFLQ